MGRLEIVALSGNQRVVFDCEGPGMARLRKIQVGGILEARSDRGSSRRLERRRPRRREGDCR